MSKRPKGDRVPKKEAPAYFLSLTVENVRCFGPEQTVTFADKDGRPVQWTVILGDNNTGKTALLQSLVGIQPRHQYRGEERPGDGITTRDQDSLRNKFFPAIIGRPGLLRHLWRSASTLPPQLRAQVCSGPFLRNKRGPLQEDTIGFFLEDTDPIRYHISEEHKFAGLVCLGYGAARRTGTTGLVEDRKQDQFASLFSDTVELINAEEWLLQADYAAKSSKAESRIGKAAIRRRDQIKDILVNLLPDVGDIRFTKPTKEQPQPRVEFETPYGWVSVDALSLGYKTMIAWMVDLASRLFDRYPDSPNPLKEPAVVLVDEIDLHMHPRWQRTIMDYLSERFPNTQFIVTAHSPLVVQAASKANVALLRREGNHVVIDNSPESIQGWRVDQILTGLFGLESARSPEVGELEEKRTALLAKARLTKADKEELQDIEEKLGDLPTADTPEDIEAMDIIRRAAKKLKEKGGHD